jgi:hypothetical protein
VLKDDHFPGCQNLKLTPLIEGAPNFRQMTGIPVYGVAIPTVTGLRNVLDAIGGQSRRVLWHSLREEPLVYVNGTPFVLREIERPFSNLELTGITRERVEQMEARLREDVLHEAQQYGGCVLVSKELDDGQVVDTWTPVESVQTPAEVYSCLQDEGYQISYVRIPITDEKVSQVSYCLDSSLSPQKRSLENARTSGVWGYSLSEASISDCTRHPRRRTATRLCVAVQLQTSPPRLWRIARWDVVARPQL